MNNITLQAVKKNITLITKKILHLQDIKRLSHFTTQKKEQKIKSRTID
jgi:hypothetical protein